MNKVMLFDVDGVLTLPEEMFSKLYTRSRGLDEAPFETFFQTQWADFVIGKRDLRRHIADNPDFWQWPGTPDSLLEYWFKAEDAIDDEMLDLVQDIRRSGIGCFLATEQEKYRGDYMKNSMFDGSFDGYFITAQIGVKKSDPRYFHMIVDQLQGDGYNVKPQDVIFFDDSQSKVDAAIAAGIDGHLFEGIETVRQALAQNGLM